MATTHSEITCEATVAAKLSETSDGVGLTGIVHIQAALALTQGIGANQINAVVVDRERNIAGASNIDFDLITLSGFSGATDPLKNAVTPANVVAVLVRNLASSPNDIQVGGAGANPWTSPFASSGTPATAKLTIPPGGFALLTAPTVAGFALSGTNKVLRVACTTGSNLFDIVVFARTA